MPQPSEPPKCPANYFGKGVDYQLPDDREAVAEYERLWREWETTHPNDPTGEIALKSWESNNGGTKVALASPPVAIVEGAQSSETSKLKLEIPDHVIKQLKNFASFKRKRPRDVIIELIQRNCIIT